MRFAGILEAGRVDGILIESQYVQGTYIVVKDVPARTNLEFNFGVLTFGTVCYVQSEDKEYRWVPNNRDYEVPSDKDDTSYLKEGHWEYIAGSTNITIKDLEAGYIYGLKLSKDGKETTWVRIDSQYIKDHLKEGGLDLDNLNKRVGDLEGNITTVNDRIDTVEQTVKDNTELVNDLNNRVGEVSNQFDDVKNSFEDLNNQFEGLKDRVDQNNQKVDSLEEKINTSVEDLNQQIKEQVDSIKESTVGTFHNNDLKYGENWTSIIEDNFEIPYATENRIGGITAAPPDKHPETLTEAGKSGWIRYFVSVGRDENAAQDPRYQYGYVDVNPSTAVVDAEILKKTFEDNPDILEEAITVVNGNTKDWWPKG